MAQNQRSGCLFFLAWNVFTPLVVLAVAVGIQYFFPSAIPIEIFFVWKLAGTAVEWAWAILPLVLFGLVANIFSNLNYESNQALENDINHKKALADAGEPVPRVLEPFQRLKFDDKSREELHADAGETIVRVHPMFILGGGIAKSLYAAIFEEIQFRWLIILNSMPLAIVLNFMTCGLVKALHKGVLGPVADFLTLGYLTEYIYFEHGWQFGFAILWSSFVFRSGHGYQGLLGKNLAWFFGMYTFGLAVTFGLPIAMLAHFIYNAMIVLYAASAASSERTRIRAAEVKKQEQEQKQKVFEGFVERFSKFQQNLHRESEARSKLDSIREFDPDSDSEEDIPGDNDPGESSDEFARRIAERAQRLLDASGEEDEGLDGSHGRNGEEDDKPDDAEPSNIDLEDSEGKPLFSLGWGGEDHAAPSPEFPPGRQARLDADFERSSRRLLETTRRLAEKSKRRDPEK